MEVKLLNRNRSGGANATSGQITDGWNQDQARFNKTTGQIMQKFRISIRKGGPGMEGKITKFEKRNQDSKENQGPKSRNGKKKSRLRYQPKKERLGRPEEALNEKANRRQAGF